MIMKTIGIFPNDHENIYIPNKTIGIFPNDQKNVFFRIKPSGFFQMIMRMLSFKKTDDFSRECEQNHRIFLDNVIFPMVLLMPCFYNPEILFEAFSIPHSIPPPAKTIGIFSL